MVISKFKKTFLFIETKQKHLVRKGAKMKLWPMKFESKIRRSLVLGTLHGTQKSQELHKNISNEYISCIEIICPKEGSYFVEFLPLDLTG